MKDDCKGFSFSKAFDEGIAEKAEVWNDIIARYSEKEETDEDAIDWEVFLKEAEIADGKLAEDDQLSDDDFVLDCQEDSKDKHLQFHKKNRKKQYKDLKQSFSPEDIKFFVDFYERKMAECEAQNLPFWYAEDENLQIQNSSSSRHFSLPGASFSGNDTNKTLSYHRSARHGPLQSSNQNRTLPAQQLVRSSLPQFDVNNVEIPNFSRTAMRMIIREYEFDMTALNTTTMPQLGAQLVNTNGADESEITSEEEEKTVSKLKQQVYKKKPVHSKKPIKEQEAASAQSAQEKKQKLQKKDQPQTKKSSKDPKRGQKAAPTQSSPEKKKKHDKTQTEKKSEAIAKGESRKIKSVPVSRTNEPLNSTCDASFYDSFKVGPNQTLDTGKYVRHVFDDESCESDSDEANVTVINRSEIRLSVECDSSDDEN